MILSGWTEFALALVVFVASHFLPRVGGLRETLIATIGRRLYFAAYGILSLVVLVWLVGSASRAPYIALWGGSGWTRMVPHVVMPFACLLAVIGVGTRWPHTLGSKRATTFDRQTPVWPR